MSDEHNETEDYSEAPESFNVEAALEQLQTENAALKEQALRYAAEAENTKRRAEREMNDARAFAIQRFSRDLLGVADVLTRALQSAPPEIADPAFKNFVTGIEMTEKELLGAFEKNGVKRIEPLKGDRFDPNVHQAVVEQPSAEVEGGGVISVLQVGYELFGRVIRPAMVAVAAKGPKTGYEAGSDSAGGTVDTQA